ncbi:hypothetical protein [uncultured Desulfuromonas sp.]|uniref:hypothetical protein n=1 Tax=uncultured Desulfuromonas sp. TaxID=181013 RepID=UPI002AAC15C4|nr:hypothetical protein [uncultured Desulfuromonas sp.]
MMPLLPLTPLRAERHSRYALSRPILITILLVFWAGTAHAHTALMACYANEENNTISCYGEFSDGSSASAIPVRVVNDNDELLLEGKMDDYGEFTFTRPDQAFRVIFDGGPGHRIIEKSATIN